MEMPVRGFRGQPVYGSQPYIVAADSKRELRLFTVKRDWSTTPKEEGITGYWSELSPKEVGDFSATAYFFRRFTTTFIGYSCRTDYIAQECFQDRDLDG
ncbi:hypothetical protein NXW37_29755 [Bacteroides thetaiotaomicron]|nr:hypothetical protein [Bacteroides thetaiotaomicron]